MNRRKFLSALLPLPVVGVAAGATIANQHTPQVVKAPFKIQDDDGNELIFEADGEGGFAVTMPQLPESDKIIHVHKPKEPVFIERDPFGGSHITNAIPEGSTGKITGLDITMPVRAKYK